MRALTCGAAGTGASHRLAGDGLSTSHVQLLRGAADERGAAGELKCDLWTTHLSVTPSAALLAAALPPCNCSGYPSWPSIAAKSGTARPARKEAHKPKDSTARLYRVSHLIGARVPLLERLKQGQRVEVAAEGDVRAPRQHHLGQRRLLRRRELRRRLRAPSQTLQQLGERSLGCHAKLLALHHHGRRSA